MTRRYSIAVIAGDGIGAEVMPPALDVLDACARRFGIEVALKELPCGSDHYRTFAG